MQIGDPVAGNLCSKTLLVCPHMRLVQRDILHSWNKRRPDALLNRFAKLDKSGIQIWLVAQAIVRNSQAQYSRIRSITDSQTIAFKLLSKHFLYKSHLN